MNEELANALSPFSRVPLNALVEVVAVGVGDGLGDGDGEVVVVGDGEGDGLGEGEVVGVGDGDGLGVVVVVTAVPEPGQVCESRIPESTPLMSAIDPAWTIRILSATSV